MAHIELSRRAIFDIEDIDEYSIKHWGKKVANKTIRDIELAMERLADSPHLLKIKPEISFHFYFYRVREHFLICDIIDENIYIVTIKHGVMDLPERLAKLEPHLVLEAEVLHRKFLKSLKIPPQKNKP